MKEIKFEKVAAPTSMKQSKDYSITKEDVWGEFNIHTGEKISKGMIVARYNDTCPVFKDIVPYKSVTIIGPLDKQDELEYWLDYVNGGGSISNVKQIGDNEIAIRSDYMCW